ncbi:MAG: hypothetical protein ACC660_04460 [Acidimicrobiales bacterium]
MADDDPGTFFPYRFDRKYLGIWWPLGVREGVDGVTVTDDSFVATFGKKRLETPIGNINAAHATLNYQWWKAVGMRLSFVDDGLTFGTATHGGVCVHFHERVRRVIGRKDHSAVTVTVDDLDGLVAALTARLAG